MANEVMLQRPRGRQMAGKVRNNAGQIRSRLGAASQNGNLPPGVPVPVSFKRNDPNQNTMLPPMRPSPDTFELQVVNASTTTAYNIILFDGFGFITEKESYTQNANITVTGLTAPYTATKRSVEANPIQIVGINYKASDSSFNNLQFDRLDLDGSRITDTITPAMAERNTQFQSDLLTLPCNVILDGNTAFRLRINASQTVNILFFIKAVMGRLT
jgi:hypothetical protein